MKTLPYPWSNASGADIPAEDESHWLTVSDLMATLMMIFLFLAVLHMVQVERLHQVETEVRVTAAESRQAI